MTFRESLYHFASRYMDGFLPVDHPVLKNNSLRRRLRVMMGTATVFVILAATRLPFAISEEGRRLTQGMTVIVIVWFSAVIVWTVWQKAKHLNAASFSLIVVAIAHNLFDSYSFPFYPSHNVPFAFAIILASHLVFGRWVSMGVLIIMTGMYLPLIGTPWPVDEGLRNPRFVAYQATFANNTIMAALLIWLISEAYDHFREESELSLIRVNREREMDLELAQNLHRELFPAAGRYGCCRFFAVSRPASTVGGDYCEALRTDNASWFAIGDVSGHGLQAGMLVMQIRAMLVYLLSSRGVSRPSRIFAELNNIFFEIVRKLNIRSYMTFFILRASDDGSFLGVGSHQKVIILRKRDRMLEILPTHGIWLGLERIEPNGGRTAELKFSLDPGDCLLMYTDGLTEIQNSAGKEFGFENVVSRLRQELSGTEFPDEKRLVECLMESIDKFRGERLPEDDVTVACICMEGGASPAE